MKPMTTISYDPAVYKLVPKHEDKELPWDVVEYLEQVPDQLLGVVVHSGEPVVFMNNSPLGEANWLEAAQVSSTAPSQQSAEALVQAALEAAKNAAENERLSCELDDCDDAYNAAIFDVLGAIRALSAQQIIESCKEKS